MCFLFFILTLVQGRVWATVWCEPFGSLPADQPATTSHTEGSPRRQVSVREDNFLFREMWSSIFSYGTCSNYTWTLLLQSWLIFGWSWLMGDVGLILGGAGLFMGGVGWYFGRSCLVFWAELAYILCGACLFFLGGASLYFGRSCLVFASFWTLIFLLLQQFVFNGIFLIFSDVKISKFKVWNRLSFSTKLNSDQQTISIQNLQKFAKLCPSLTKGARATQKWRACQ